MIISVANLVSSGAISIHLVKGSTATIISIDPSATGGLRSIIKSKHQSLNDSAYFSVGRRQSGSLNLTESF